MNFSVTFSEKFDEILRDFSECLPPADAQLSSMVCLSFCLLEVIGTLAVC